MFDIQYFNYGKTVLLSTKAKCGVVLSETGPKSKIFSVARDLRETVKDFERSYDAELAGGEL